jgi:tRNA G18 (ribose-2'-O)-methylase SpoU
VQSTTGTLLSIWIRRNSAYIKLVETLKGDGFTLVAADLNGTEDLQPLKLKQKLLLALGNEAAGLSQQALDAADYRIRIPIIDKRAQSLNVAACGTILMYLRRQIH